METLMCTIHLHVRGVYVCEYMCVRRLLLIDVLTAQSSSTLSEKEEAACSEKLQMSESRTVSGFLMPGSFSSPLLWFVREIGEPHTNANIDKVRNVQTKCVARKISSVAMSE